MSNAQLLAFATGCKLTEASGSGTGKALSEKQVELVFQQVKLGKKNTIPSARFEEALRKMASARAQPFTEMVMEASENFTAPWRFNPGSP